MKKMSFKVFVLEIIILVAISVIVFATGMLLYEPHWTVKETNYVNNFTGIVTVGLPANSSFVCVEYYQKEIIRYYLTCETKPFCYGNTCLEPYIYYKMKDDKCCDRDIYVGIYSKTPASNECLLWASNYSAVIVSVDDRCKRYELVGR